MSRRDLSDSQANAEALARRSAPYTAAHEASFRVAWDFNRREPDSLRDAVRMVRRAHADEIPEKLNDSAIGEDGNPRMNARAVGYIMGDPRADDAARDAETGQRGLSGWHFTPFRAALATMEDGNEQERFIGAVVRRITIGGQGPKEALVEEGVPTKAATLLAMPLLRSFLRSMTDLRLHVHEDHEQVA